MTAAVIIDIVIVLVLVGFTAYGAKRGLYQALTGLLIVVVALFGAAMVAGSFAPPVAKMIAPVVEEHFAEQIQGVLESYLKEGGVVPGDLTESLSGLPGSGFLTELLEKVGTAMEQAADSAAEAAAAAATAAVEGLIQSFAYCILFILAFILLLLLLRVLCAAMGLLTKLPGVYGLNALGGAAFGLAEGVLLVFLVVFMLGNLGITLDTPALQEAHILRIFRENTPITLVTSLL